MDVNTKKEAGRVYWQTANYAASQVEGPYSLQKQYLKWYMFEFMRVMFVCAECRDHYPVHLEKVNRVYNFDNYVKNPETALYFVYLVHDSVSKSIAGTKLYSFEEIKQKYLVPCQSCAIRH